MESRALHSSSLVIDALSGGFVPMPPSRDGVDYIDRLHRAGVDTVSVTLAARFATFEDALWAFYDHELVWELYGDRLRRVLKPQDIVVAKEVGRVGVLLGFQTGTPVGQDLRRLTILHMLGLRMMSLTYMEANYLGSGCLEPIDHGLTHLGRQVVREMNRLGMIVDLSHVGDKTSLDAIDVSEVPVMFSHSGARAVTNHPRNITDEMISRCGERGGLICATTYGACTSPRPAVGTQPTVADFVKHVHHMVDLVGVGSVGIGTDMFEAKGAGLWNATTKRRYPESVAEFTRDTVNTVGISSMSDWPVITDALSKAGYSDDDVRQMIGGNFLRVFGEVTERASQT